jgi:hypothetical protein
LILWNELYEQMEGFHRPWVAATSIPRLRKEPSHVSGKESSPQNLKIEPPNWLCVLALSGIAGREIRRDKTQSHSRGRRCYTRIEARAIFASG